MKLLINFWSNFFQDNNWFRNMNERKQFYFQFSLTVLL